MFSILPVTKVITIIAATYAIAFYGLVAFFEYIKTPLGPFKAFGFSLALELIIVTFAYWGWRKIWKAIPLLAKIIYPDLNGKWNAKIEWSKGGEKQSTTGTVIIKQDFFKASIEMEATHSDSRTIALTIKKDNASSKPLLHYIYEVTQRHSATEKPEQYTGAATLFLEDPKNGVLKGNYFTNRGNKGTFTFVRISEDHGD